LCFSRNEIENFAKENAIQWREDSSNASDKYLRNKLRHDVIPVLKELNPNLLTSFEKTIENLMQSQSLVVDASQLVYKIVVEESDNVLKINLKELLKLPNYAAYLFQWLKQFEFTAWYDIYDLVYAQSGKHVFSENHVLLKDRDFLILSARVDEQENEVFYVEKNQKDVKIPLNMSICNVSDISNANPNCIFVDEAKLQFPLIIRKWEEGDYFYPLGMKGKKKLSKYFKDEKLSLIDKSSQLILCSDNQIVWIIGKRQDERFKVETNTTNIVQITLQ
jgi:tRNA(Ile)-lysidine synthase